MTPAAYAPPRKRRYRTTLPKTMSNPHPLFRRRSAPGPATHYGSPLADIQRRILAGYAEACETPLVLVRDPADPKGYRWENPPEEEEGAHARAQDKAPRR